MVRQVNIYLSSLLLYAVPASLVSGILMYVGYRKRQLSWHVGEYVLVYTPWAMATALAVFISGGLQEAMIEMAFPHGLYIFFSIVAGILGGISLLPRIIFHDAELGRLMMTSISAFVVGTIYLKIIVVATIFTGV
ncbi:MAG: hypothetical protein R8M38_09535 [Mariprofundaceae bacterium]